MLKIGITGGIGTGKTFVCQLFKLLTIPIYDADTRAKWLCENNANLILNIKKLLGQKAYSLEGKYNKAHVAVSIFNDPTLKLKLERIIHPAVLLDSESWFDQLSKKNVYPYGIKEAALLFESGSSKYLDKIIAINAPLEIRIKRIEARDHITEEAVLIRIKNQWPNEEKIRLADFVINNDGVQTVIPQVIEIHKKLLSLSQEKI